MDVARFAWLVTVVLTGTAAGAMVGHTVLLGRFLSWMFERLYTSVEVDEEGLARVKRLAADAPIVLCPSPR